MSLEYQRELNSLLESMQNIHFPNGKTFQNSKRCQSELLPPDREMEKIFHLVESHTPGLRTLTTLQFDKASSKGSECLPLSKHFVNFQCGLTIEKSIENLLKMVAEMPKEWVLVQLTPAFNPKDSFIGDCKTLLTDAIHLSVFNCGQSKDEPLCITVNPPLCPVTGEVVELRQEMANIITEHYEMVKNVVKTYGRFFKARKEKITYEEEREIMNGRLKQVVKQLQNDWLGVWRCLLSGKYLNRNVEEELKEAVENFCKERIPFEVKSRIKILLLHLVKGSPYLSTNEIRVGLLYIFSDQTSDFINKVLKFIRGVQKSLCLSNKQQRHPVILIIDEKLDLFPWEMIDIIQDHPVSRMPSFHFTYALFKEHENSIVNGVKTNINPKNGSYIVNPNNDLKQMELRLKSFFDYWAPEWKGVVGKCPTSEEFAQCLTGCDVFSYNGHGSGVQYLPGDKIKKLRVNAVVLLFGCSSMKLSALGPQVELVGPHYMYLIACCPCVLGMLWAVTDLDTDRLACGLLSQWLPSKAEVDWKNVDKTKWEALGNIEPAANLIVDDDKKETELLRVMCKVRKFAKQYTNQAAFVARGLPVKIQ